MALRYLFIDFDSFFASVEQQFQPHLRGKPIGVVPSLGVDNTSCIAASYEAKARGVKTGTGVREARFLCPGIQFVQSNHSALHRNHNQIHKIIHEIIYVDAVLSIDEMFGRLPPHWQPPEVARAKAWRSKPRSKPTSAPTSAPPSASLPTASSPNSPASSKSPTADHARLRRTA